MLIQFRFQNFKSFKDDTILDFSATKITEHGGHIVSLGGEKILPAAAIFGANASGKSNVIEAFRFMAKYVVNSFNYGGDNEKEKIKTLKPTPFLLDADSREAESSFEVYFIGAEKGDEKTYNYGFTINRDGIIEEWLNTKAKNSPNSKRIFYRNHIELALDNIPTKSRENIMLALENEVLIVSLGAKLKIDILKKVRDWFFNLNFMDFSDPIENVYLSRRLPKGFVDDETVRRNTASFLASFDPSIVDFEVERLEGNGERTRVKIDAVHIDRDGNAITIPLSQESSGTLKMLSLYPLLQDTIENGGVLIVDELNARLHPLLVRNFLLTFLNPEINVNHAQIMFTTHDSWQLSNNLFRRDEIWFTEKDKNGASSIYSLADFIDENGDKIRKDENYEKNYLLGKYGAIPNLKYFDVLGGED